MHFFDVDFKQWSSAVPSTIKKQNELLERAPGLDDETYVAITTAQLDLLLKKRRLPGLFPDTPLAQDASMRSVSDIVMRHRLCKFVQIYRTVNILRFIS